MNDIFIQIIKFSSNRTGFLLIKRPALSINQTELPACGGKSGVGVVFPQRQSVFCPTGEHAVRLVGPQGDEVIN